MDYVQFVHGFTLQRVRSMNLKIPSILKFYAFNFSVSLIPTMLHLQFSVSAKLTDAEKNIEAEHVFDPYRCSIALIKS